MYTVQNEKLRANFHLTADSNALLKTQMNSVIWVHSCRAIKSVKSLICMKCRDVNCWMRHTHSHPSDMHACFHPCYHITSNIAMRCVQFDRNEEHRWMKHYACRICVYVCDLRSAYVQNSMEFKIAQNKKNEWTKKRDEKKRNIPRTLQIVMHCFVSSRSNYQRIWNVYWKPNWRSWNIMASIPWVQCEMDYLNRNWFL